MGRRIPYNKPHLTYSQQLDQLKARGLTIEDEDKALFLLKRISYYRLSAYWYPLLEEPKSAHQFKSGSTFNQAFQLYCFDRKLRQLILAELEKIEVAVRSEMIYQYSEAYGPYWFDDVSLFRNSNQQNRAVTKMTEEYNRSDEAFILAFKNKYSNPLPPAWILLEVVSFGTLSVTYKHLRPNRVKRNVADSFSLNKDVLTSWLHSIVYLRNICAHHSRLWNRDMRITPARPVSPHRTFLPSHVRQDKVFYFLSAILYLLEDVNPRNTFKERLEMLIDEYPVIDKAAMGFPEHYKEYQLWK